MGVNMAGFCIYNDEAVCAAARQEISRRYYTALCNRRQGVGNDVEVQKIEILMQQLSIDVQNERKCVGAANAKAEETGAPAVAIELTDGRVVTGKTSSLLGASSAALLNAIKAVAGIDDKTDLISEEIIKPIHVLKTENLGNHNPRLHTDEVLIALAVSAANNPDAKRALDSIGKLRNSEVHSTVILSQVDSSTFRKLGISLSCEPKYQTKKLFHGR